MKRATKALLTLIAAAVLAFSLLLATACSSSDPEQTEQTELTEQTEQTAIYVTSIEKTGTNGTDDIYTITYSDGTTSTFTVSNGSDGKDVSINDIYEQYKETTGTDICFADFLKQYLTVSDQTTALAVNSCLLSSMKIYSEFVQTSQSFDPYYGVVSSSNTAISTGSAVIYSMAADGYTYIVTNYHVVYNKNADAEKNGGSKIARKIYGYLYGSENTPSTTDSDNDNQADTDSDGYTLYDYGSYAIELEYVGGSVISDIAVLRAETEDIAAINADAKAVTLASDYHVGETAIAIGNPEGKGLSVTQGVISTENEQITLDIDGTARSYRSLRIDTPLYEGNSGGGLFNADGELIGITNAGNSEDQNINYAVPLEIVKGTVENILHYYNDGDSSTTGAYKITLGVTVTTQNSKYVYDASSGYGSVQEEVIVNSVTSGSIAETLGLQANDKIVSLFINDTEYTINRSFRISDLILTMRENDIIKVKYERTENGETAEHTSEGYPLARTDLVQLD